jgi:hypothetical protein
MLSVWEHDWISAIILCFSSITLSFFLTENHFCHRQTFINGIIPCKTEINLSYTERFISYRAVNTVLLGYENETANLTLSVSCTEYHNSMYLFSNSCTSIRLRQKRLLETLSRSWHVSYTILRGTLNTTANVVQGIIAVCTSHAKHINAICGHNIEIWMLNLVVPEVTTRVERVKFVKNPFLLFLVCS